ncbi:flagellar hook-length control protein FliK [Aliiroseovarius sp. PrR006]|uniref:flagellar hook-length control protein FliK n=1 Tax=Aliiroseovarius sp. PrR006 TaxID=2706883 RepID=UPI0013D03199|nr:flagellar hook-length control protein FliK [Aliiroseovarius sp. PrR006]NDW54574.1 flagellar hook-length control protein FliK [Aliiroseovarius sp. PrR006]
MVELPIELVVKPTAEPGEEVQVAKGQTDPELMPLLELAELSQSTPNHAKELRKTLPEAAIPAQRMTVPSAQEGIKLDEPVRPLNSALPDTARTRSEPDPARLEGREGAIFTPRMPSIEMPDAAEVRPWDNAETEAPNAISDTAQDEPDNERLVPVDQGGKTFPVPYDPVKVPPLSAEPLRFTPQMEARMAHEALPSRSNALATSNLQHELAQNAGGAASAAQVTNSGPAAIESGQVSERPEEFGGLSQGKTAVPSRPSEPQNAGTSAPTSVVGQVQQKTSPELHAEELAPDASAPRSASELSAKIMPALETAKQAPLSWAVAPLTYLVEQEADGPVPDDMGLRVVEHVSSSAGDLKSAAHTRGTEVPRMVMAQIAEIVRQQPDRPVELTLSPEELGRLRMSFQSEGSAMHVVLSFERPDTLDLMRRHIDQLAQDMRELGMSDVSFTFQQQPSEGGNGTHSDDGSAPASQIPQSDQESPSEDAGRHALNIAGRAGVDIRV